jgi:hypothetical protein
MTQPAILAIDHIHGTASFMTQPENTKAQPEENECTEVTWT